MSVIAQDFSGVAINYDNAYTNTLTLGATPIAQTFVLPSNYMRGTLASEQIIPDLSGFQILCSVPDASTASWSWQVGYTNVASPTIVSQFTIVQSGVTTGTYQSGLVWFDIIFNEPISVAQNQLDDVWMVLLTPSNIDYVTYFIYNYQGFALQTQGYFANSISPGNPNAQLSLAPLNPQSSLFPSPTLYPSSSLFPASAQSADSAGSFNFRVLTLSADEGTDFLGNQYRSAVLPTNVSNVDPLISNDINSYWISPPLPSSQAVVSHYFDMRETPFTAQYGVTNLIPDPSFEYDAVDSLPANYGVGSNASAQVVSGISYSGTKALEYVRTTDVAGNGYIDLSSLLPIKPSTNYTFSLYALNNVGDSIYQIRAVPSPSGISFAPTATQLSNNDWTLLTISFTSGPSDTSLQLYFEDDNTTSPVAGASAYIDALELVEGGPAVYFDGDQQGCVWLGTPGNSDSIQILPDQTIDAPIVIDAITIDPLFPNQTYNIYYSNDDNGTLTPSTTEEWETKLWTLAQSAVTNYGNETIVLPQPIAAKYIKVEMTNPQLQRYDPGDFQLPMIYKTFPSWVQNYFLSQVNPPSYDTDQVVVVNDALSTVYTPFLGDLGSQPSLPNVPSPSTYVIPANNLDSTTLGQINLDTAPYQSPLGTQANTSTALGSIVSNQLSNTLSGPLQVSEAAPPTYSPITTVSSSQRDSVLLDLLYPNMYFYYTSRHQYQLVSATLSNNKAYFFGIKNINFLRSQGTVVEDAPLYTETGQDMANAQLNDFTIDSSGFWDTYAAN